MSSWAFLGCGIIYRKYAASVGGLSYFKAFARNPLLEQQRTKGGANRNSDFFCNWCVRAAPAH
jgi:hypothetical protein